MFMPKPVTMPRRNRAVSIQLCCWFAVLAITFLTAAAFGQAANPAIPPEATQPLIPDPDAGAAPPPAATAQTPAPTPAPAGQVPQASAPGTISTTAKPAPAPNTNASNTPAANNPAPELQQQK